MLTFNDVNRDLKIILDGISDTSREVPSTMKAMRGALILPLLGILFSTVTFGFVCAQINHRDVSVNLFIDYIFSGGAIPVYMSVVVGFAQWMMLLPYITLYYSIPHSIRAENPLVSHVKRAFLKGGILYGAVLLLTCLMSFHNEIYLFSTPIVMFVAIFVATITINLQVTKYGVGSLIGKLKKVLS